MSLYSTKSVDRPNLNNPFSVVIKHCDEENIWLGINTAENTQFANTNYENLIAEIENYVGADPLGYSNIVFITD